MIKLEVTITEDRNAAFEEGDEELHRLLRHVVSEIGQGVNRGTLRDYNGNKVGEWWLTDDK